LTDFQVPVTQAAGFGGGLAFGLGLVVACRRVPAAEAVLAGCDVVAVPVPGVAALPVPGCGAGPAVTVGAKGGSCPAGPADTAAGSHEWAIWSVCPAVCRRHSLMISPGDGRSAGVFARQRAIQCTQWLRAPVKVGCLVHDAVKHGVLVAGPEGKPAKRRVRRPVPPRVGPLR
jgi:hypothetical protein